MPIRLDQFTANSFECICLRRSRRSPVPPGDPLPKITDGYEEVVGGYERALIAAAHHFAGAGELDHLGALLAKHPGFVDAKLKFAGPRKPVSGDRFSLLHRASANGRVDVVKFLIGKRAELEADDGYGWTPLHLAAKGGHLDVVKLLVGAGADVGASTTARPSSPIPGGPPNRPPEYSSPVPAYTPLEIATGYKHAEVVEFLKTKLAAPPKK